MLSVSSRERARFNRDPLTDVDYHHDISYLEDDVSAHQLDVLTPRNTDGGHHQVLPVYVYFHGGGWTSGDKSALTKY